jgi:nitric oxide reductase subunit C
MARNIFYGGTLFFVLLFAVLIFDTEQRIPERSNAPRPSPRGGARQADLGNAQLHRLPHAAGRRRLLRARAGQRLQAPRPDFIKAWMKAQPTHARAAARCRSSTLDDQQLDDLTEFLKWTNGINTEKWPPNIEG